MIAEKNTMANLNTLQPNIDSGQTLLNDITTTSKVAGWRLFFFIVALAIVTLENLWDSFILLVNSTLEAKEPGSILWYKTKSLEFQYGDSLQLVGTKFIYSPINTANRIVSQCAVIDGNPLTIKIAKTVSGNLTALNSGEKSSFEAYINSVKFAGTQINVVSQLADELGVIIKIVYDPLVLDNTGQLISNPGTYPVLDAINTYLKTLEFNGDLVLNKLVDQLQKTTGVVDPILQQAKARIGTNPFVVFVEKYSSIAGYMTLNLSNTTITYVANV